MTMIINRTHRHDATFGCRIETELNDPAPIKVHVGTMDNGWLDPRISLDLTVANALNIIATLQELVDHADLVAKERKANPPINRGLKDGADAFFAASLPLGFPINPAAEPPVTEFGSIIDRGASELDVLRAQAKASSNGIVTGIAESGPLGVRYYPNSDRFAYFSGEGVIGRAKAEFILNHERMHRQMNEAVDSRIKQTIEDSGGGKTLVVELPDEDTVIANLQGYMTPNDGRTGTEAVIDKMWASMVNKPFEKQAEILRDHLKDDNMRRLVIPSKRFGDWARANVAQLTGLATEVRS